jgi:hypothetical protein
MYPEQTSTGGMFTNGKEKLKVFFYWLPMSVGTHRLLVAFDVLLYAERSYVDERGDERDKWRLKYEAVDHASRLESSSCAAFKAKLMHS